MKITPPKDKYIFIELTRDDMEKMNITYDNLDYSNPHTRKIIHHLLNEAKQSLGYPVSLPGKVRVDALPSVEGGCLLFFTVCTNPVKYKLKGKEAELVFSFEKQDYFFDLAMSLSENETKNIKSSLYLHEGKLMLLVSGKIKHSIVAKINEYAFPVKTYGQGKALIKEYGDCIVKGKALEIYRGSFSQ